MQMRPLLLLPLLLLGALNLSFVAAFTFNLFQASTNCLGTPTALTYSSIGYCLPGSASSTYIACANASPTSTYTITLYSSSTSCTGASAAPTFETSGECVKSTTSSFYVDCSGGTQARFKYHVYNENETMQWNAHHTAYISLLIYRCHGSTNFIKYRNICFCLLHTIESKTDRFFYHWYFIGTTPATSSGMSLVAVSVWSIASWFDCHWCIHCTTV
jgi:hypothetical protein